MAAELTEVDDDRLADEKSTVALEPDGDVEPVELDRLPTSRPHEKPDDGEESSR